MDNNSSLVEWLGIEIDEIYSIYKLYGGITPPHLQYTLRGSARPHHKSIEIGFSLATLGLTRNNSDHVVVADDQPSEAVFRHYCPTVNIKRSKLANGQYDWEPALGELYDLIYVHHNQLSRTFIYNKIPEFVGPYARILIDNIPDEETYNIYEDLATKLDYEAWPKIVADRLLLTLKPTGDVLGMGPGTELIRIFHDMGMAQCQLCITLANRMNRWGVAGSLENIDIIVDDILPRAKRWWSRSKPWMKAEVWWKSNQSLYSRFVQATSIVGGTDHLLRESITVHVMDAIRNAESHDVPALNYHVGDRPRPAATNIVLDSQRRSMLSLANTYSGTDVYLICGGPSLTAEDLSHIPQSATIAAVNQVAATHIKPDLWFCTDDPSRFHASIWEDPTITKFVPYRHIQDFYKVWNGQEWCQQSERSAADCPNTYFVDCVDEWSDNFLDGPVSWNTGAGYRSVLMVALRLLYWLGFKNVYLLGCDFRMSHDSCYAFPEQKNPISRWRNNMKYRALNYSLGKLRHLFDERGFFVYNCTNGGNLHTLPRMPLKSI